MEEALEVAKRNPVAGLLACVGSFVLVLALAYWVGPLERLDRSVLDILSTPTDTLVNEVAYVGFQVVNFRPTWVVVGAVATLIGLAQGRIRDAIFAAVLVAGTAGWSSPSRRCSPIRATSRYRSVRMPIRGRKLSRAATPPDRWRCHWPSSQSYRSRGGGRRPSPVSSSLSTSASASWPSTTTTQAMSSPAGCSRLAGTSLCWLSPGL